jgi:hypothetical protein
MINTQVHVIALRERIDSTRRLIDATHPGASSGSPISAGPISREARGLAIVLLFAAYENLLTSLTRTLLERALSLKVSNRRLRPGFRAFALVSSARSIKDLSENKMYSHGLPRLVEAADRGGRICTIDPSSFPTDGSFMKTSQIRVWCELFEIANPNLVLRRTWGKIEAVVSERNGVAHGRLTPEEVGRGYSEPEIRQLIFDWRDDWLDFLQVITTVASTRDSSACLESARRQVPAEWARPGDHNVDGISGHLRQPRDVDEEDGAAEREARAGYVSARCMV